MEGPLSRGLFCSSFLEIGPGVQVHLMVVSAFFREMFNPLLEYPPVLS